MKHTGLNFAVLAIAALCATSGHAAGSILGQSYELTTSTLYDDSIVGTGGPVSATAQTGLPRLDLPNAEALDERTSFSIYWADGDSFFLLVTADPNARGASGIERATIDLSGLVFKDGAVPVDVVGVSFNLAGSDLASYLASPDNPTGAPAPQIDASFAPGPVGDWQVRVELNGYAGQLVGDQAYMRFDVQTAAVVPEPSTYALFGLGLVGLGVARRRRAGA